MGYGLPGWPAFPEDLLLLVDWAARLEDPLH